MEKELVSRGSCVSEMRVRSLEVLVVRESVLRCWVLVAACCFLRETHSWGPCFFSPFFFSPVFCSRGVGRGGRKEGKKAGRKQGRKEGREEARKEGEKGGNGRNQGRHKEGKKEERRDNSKTMGNNKRTESY